MASITIDHIAKASDVSRWTVSAILFPSEKNKRVGYSEETRKKVLATVKRLRYRSHRASRNLLSRRHGVIGIITAQFFMIPWSSIQAMLVKARSYDQVLSFEYIPPDHPELPLFIRENVVDGLIIYEAIAPAIEQAIAYHRIPTVYVNSSRHDHPNSINMDEEGAIKRGVKHLAETGRKRPTLITSSIPTALYELERVKALHRACKRERLEIPWVLSLQYTPVDLVQLTEFLTKHPKCDAMIAPHPGFVGMIFKVCQKIGRRIPDDLAVICMQDSDFLHTFEPPVTAFELQERTMGEQAVDMLHQLISGKEMPTLELEYQFHIRQSTRKPKSMKVIHRMRPCI